MRRRETIGGAELAFDDEGQGPALVLLAPFPFDRRIWADTVPALRGAGRRVIALDYPGFGDSAPPPPHQPLSIDGLADLVAGVLDLLALPRAGLLGLSMGGYVALAFAGRFPERLESLALADTRAPGDSPTSRAGRATALAAIRDNGVEAYLQQSVPRLLAEAAPANTRARALALAERRPEALIQAIEALRDRPDRTADLARIACPTLVIAGEADRVTPAAEMRELAAAIAGAVFVAIPGAGHLSNLEAPAAFNTALLDFLRAGRSR
ncbi:MAG: alpha/beta fold hydrolase [Pseudomonadota bacterium]